MAVTGRPLSPTKLAYGEGSRDNFAVCINYSSKWKENTWLPGLFNPFKLLFRFIELQKNPKKQKKQSLLQTLGFSKLCPVQNLAHICDNIAWLEL
jgi:hypothetical protein